MMADKKEYTPEQYMRMTEMVKEFGFDSVEQYDRLFDRAQERVGERGGKHVLNLADWLAYDFTRKGLLQVIAGTYKFKGIKIFVKDGQTAISFPDDPDKPIDADFRDKYGKELDVK